MADLGHGEPWPFDCVIGGMGLMLTKGPNKESPWMEQKVKYFDPQSVMTAEDRTYAQFPPEIDFPKVQDTWKGGYGASHQQVDTKERYAYTRYADCSSGHPQKGPKMVDPAQTLTGAPSNMVTFTVAGTEKVFFAVGTRLYRRDDDTATGMVLVSNLGQTIGQMVVFRGTQSADYLFIPLGTGAVYQTLSPDGTTLTAHATQKANGFVVAGDELFLYVLVSNQWLLKKAWDGGTAAVWIGNYTVGDSTASVNDAHMAAGRLILGKSNGLYAVSALVSPLAEDVTPGLHPFNNSTNCINSVIFDENYVFIYDGGLLRYDPSSGKLDQFGPETINDNQSVVKGQVVAVTSQDGLAIHAVIYNTDNTTSYLGKWGTWDQGPEAESKFIPSWHFALHEWSKRACMLQAITLDWGTGAGRITRIYVGFTDGTFQYYYAARTSNPADDPNYDFDTAHDGEIYLSRFTALFPFETKVLKQIGLVGHSLSGTNQIGAQYKIPTDSSYTDLGVISEEPGDKLSPGVNSTPADKAFDIKLVITNASASSSPKLDTAVIFCAIRFDNLKEIVCWINVSDGVLNRKGQQLRQRWQDIRNKIENTANLSGSVTVISPTGEVLTCLAIEFGHALAVEDKEKDMYKWSSRLRMVQTRSSATRGTWDRAGLSTWDDLSAFTWDQVRVI